MFQIVHEISLRIASRLPSSITSQSGHYGLCVTNQSNRDRQDKIVIVCGCPSDGFIRFQFEVAEIDQSNRLLRTNNSQGKVTLITSTEPRIVQSPPPIIREGILLFRCDVELHFHSFN